MKVKLGDVIKPATVVRCNDNTYPVLSMTMHNGIVLQEERFKKSIASLNKSDYKVVDHGQLVIGFPIDEGVLYVQKVAQRGIMSPAYSVWNVNHEIISHDYLEYSLHSYHAMQFYKAHLRGTTARRRSIPIETLLELPIPLPPLEEQRRIAAVLDKVSDLIAKRREQLDKLDKLVKARFVEMFGDPVSNPKKWNLLSFREAGVRLSDGPFGSNLKSEHYTTEGVRVIRLGNIGVGQFIDNDKSYISEQHYEKLRKYTCRSGEIVIGTLGDPNLRACLVPKTIEFAINKADCVHYIPKPEILNTRFVCQYINCPETLLLASGMVHGQTRSRISSGQLAEMPIFVPPMELQEQYAAFAEQADKSKLTIQRSLDKIETLKKALMQAYFG